MALQCTPQIGIDEDELEESFVRASGPGGQNVNKLSTAVQLRFDVRRSRSLPDAVAVRLMRLAGRRLTGDGVLVITAQRFRTQERNRADARERLAAMVDAGVSSLSVSIDGLEDSHDYLRGVPGSWRRAFSTLRRARAAGLAGGVPSVEASLARLHNTQLEQLAGHVGLEILGPEGQLTDDAEEAPMAGIVYRQWVRNIPTTLTAGTTEVQKNIIARRGLGLPKSV